MTPRSMFFVGVVAVLASTLFAYWYANNVAPRTMSNPAYVAELVER